MFAVIVISLWVYSIAVATKIRSG